MSAEIVLTDQQQADLREGMTVCVYDNVGVPVALYPMVAGLQPLYADLPYRVALTQADVKLIGEDPVGLVCVDARVTGIGWTIRMDGGQS